MHLVVDQGNSFIKIAVFGQEELIQINILENEYVGKIIDVIKMIRREHKEMRYAIFSSVIQETDEIVKLLNTEFHLLIMSHGCRLPVAIEYNTPETLGLDRIAAVVGACGLFPTNNLLSIDAGTCVTYDFINSYGNYLGGGISPGIQMRFEALHTFTSKLPLVSRESEIPLIGNTTKNSILSGVLNGITAEIDGIISRYKRKFPDLKIILTGGDANYFDKKLKNDIFAVPNLVLMGLRDILLYNVEK